MGDRAGGDGGIGRRVADGDEFHDSCTLVVAGRPINVPEPLEQVLDCIDGGKAP